MSEPWADPRTGIWYLRKRVPARFKAVAGRKSDIIKISTGTADRKECLRRWPEVLRQWADLEAGWERKLNVVAATPERAREIAAKWAASVAAAGIIKADGRTSDVFEPLDLPEEQTPERLARMWDVIEAHADEAARVAGVEISPETRPILLHAMAPVVRAAYLAGC
jgi:hypothetical protein